MKVIKVVRIDESNDYRHWYTDDYLEVIGINKNHHPRGDDLYTLNVITDKPTTLVKEHSSSHPIIHPRFVRDLTDEEMMDYREVKLKIIMNDD